MAVRLEQTTRRYIGSSADPKPAVGVNVPDPITGTVRTVAANDLPAGSTFFEEDTGNIWRWNGAEWTLPVDRAHVDLTDLTQAVSELRRELVALRLGMMRAGTCDEVKTADVDEALAFDFAT